LVMAPYFFFFSSRRRHTRFSRDWSSDVCSSDLVPLTGPVVHIVARGTPAGMPDLGTLAAFAVQPGMGLCMAPGIWHATRVPDAPVTCLMLTRQSTTQDLVAHLRDGAPAHESALANIALTNWEIAPHA